MNARSCVSFECGEQLAGQELLRRAYVVTVGAEARAGDDESLESERSEIAKTLRADVGRADHGEAVDELGRECRGVRGRVAQVLVAVVAAADLGDDVAVG